MSTRTLMPSVDALESSGIPDAFLTGDIQPETSEEFAGFPVEDDDVDTPLGPSVYACEACGSVLRYSGRGRKPKLCNATNGGNESCYATRKGKTARVGSGTALAERAATVLITGNEMLSFAFTTLSLPETGGALALGTAEPAFRAMVVDGLTMNPGLCRKILRGGSESGSMVLILAYAMLGMRVIPVATDEIRRRRSENGT